jgi:hypothetical protein
MTSGRSADSQTHTGFLRMCIDDFCYNSPTPMELPPLSRICSKGPQDSPKESCGPTESPVENSALKSHQN